jgi:hypothetical protein
VDVDHHRPPGGGESAVDGLRHRGGVGVEIRVQQGLLVGVRAPQHVPVGGALVDCAHADGQHLLALVGEALGVDHQPGQTVDEPPGSEPCGPGGPRGDVIGVRVGDVVQLPLQGRIVEQDAVTDGSRDRSGGVRDVQQHRRALRAGDDPERCGCVRHGAAPSH